MLFFAEELVALVTAAPTALAVAPCIETHASPNFSSAPTK
jgi:hypothetical protein